MNLTPVRSADCRQPVDYMERVLKKTETAVWWSEFRFTADELNGMKAAVGWNV